MPTRATTAPQYGAPVVKTDTEEITLVFPAASLLAAQNGAMQLSATTNISRERFPQLLAALAQGSGPSMVVQDEKCTTVQSGGGEGYYGATCTGTPVETATNAVNPYSGGGEGYYGSEPAVIPDGSQATIALNLKLTQVASAPSASSAAAQNCCRKLRLEQNRRRDPGVQRAPSKFLGHTSPTNAPSLLLLPLATFLLRARRTLRDAYELYSFVANGGDGKAVFIAPRAD